MATQNSNWLQDNDLCRAWSDDWSRSITFTAQFINSDKWASLGKYIGKRLGNWGWEVSTSGNPAKSDVEHLTYDSFNIA